MFWDEKCLINDESEISVVGVFLVVGLKKKDDKFTIVNLSSSYRVFVMLLHIQQTFMIVLL